ncbi:MAG: sigma-70 family RNA polymerase sigma factor [Phaeodactylibacter sp.]|nr:sigma-70 family RNA polymerase sigma factor [Phaeodactylibacter sp.]MCB9273116.1 sigma-70 family RNA polymerase sigma factor [Lewinellaceae bacterium]
MPKQSPSAFSLVERAREGDQAAFRQLVTQHESLVRATVRGMLGDTAEADDAAQETFIRFYQSLPNFRGEAEVSTYLCRIAINLSINELRKRQRRSRWLSVAAREGEPGDREDTGANPGRQEMREMLIKALQILGPEFRSVVTLRLIDGYSVKETADILSLPEGTVASRLARGQQKLREILEKWL